MLGPEFATFVPEVIEQGRSGIAHAYSVHTNSILDCLDCGCPSQSC